MIGYSRSLVRASASVDEEVASKWTRRGSEALCFPFPESIPADSDGLSVMIWLSFRSLAQYPEHNASLADIRKGLAEFEVRSD